MPRRASKAAGVAILAALMMSAGGMVSAQPAPHASLSPATVQRLNELAAMVFQQGQPDAAVPRIRALLAEDPTLAEAHFLLGAAYTLQESGEMLGEAKAELRQALALKPALLQARLYLASVYMQLGRAASARDELRTALEQTPGQPQLLTQLAEAERQSGDAAAALATSDQALTGDPGNQQAHYHRALALVDLGRPAEAIVELTPLATAGVPEAGVYETLGRLQLDAGQTRQALATLRAGAAMVPGRATLQLLTARALRMSGDLAGADAALAKARAAQGPPVASAAFQQTEADLALEEGLLRLAQNRTSDAVGALEAAVAISPEYGAAHRGLAQALLARGETAKAAAAAAAAARYGAPLAKADQDRLDAATARGAAHR